MEQLLCIDENTDALYWRIRIIDMAREELILSTFDLIGDNSGLDIMAALMRAQQRGVRIRMLIDGFNGLRHLSLCRPFWYLISLPGITVRYYNPVRKEFPLQNIHYRLHDKYLIADHRAYLLGGRNLCDVSLGNYIEKVNIDRDILVVSEGGQPSASLTELKNYFETIWRLPCCSTVQLLMKDVGSSEECLLNDRYGKLQNMLSAEHTESWQESMMSASEIRLLSNPVAAEKKTPELWNAIYGEMYNKNNIIIQTPYMICNKKMYRDLTRLCLHSKRVRIVTNSPETGANPWGCSDYLNEKDNILKTGAEIYEYSGRQSMHTKTVLIDRDLTITGSFNMDMRSAYLDTELMLWIRSPQLNAHIAKVTAEQMEYCRHLYPDGTAETGTSYEHMAMGSAKKAVYSCLRMLCIVAAPGRRYL